MDRRTLLKILGGIAALPALVKSIKGTGIKATKVAGKILPKVSGMPEWFTPLVNKIMKNGQDISPEVKRLEDTVYIKKLKDGDTTFTLTEKPLDGEITISIDSPRNPFDQTVDLHYKKPKTDFDVETGKKINEPGEFKVVETEPSWVGHWEDPSLELDVRTSTVDTAAGDVDAAERFATGKIKNREKIKERRKIKDQMENSPGEYLESEYGPGPDYKDYNNPEYANGGIASFVNGGKAKKKFIENENQDQELSTEELEAEYEKKLNENLTRKSPPGLNFTTQEGGEGGINLMFGPKIKQDNYPGFGPKRESNINPKMDLRDPRLGLYYSPEPENQIAPRFYVNIGPKGSGIGFTKNFANGGSVKTKLTKTVPPVSGPDPQGVETLFRRRYS